MHRPFTLTHLTFRAIGMFSRAGAIAASLVLCAQLTPNAAAEEHYPYESWFGEFVYGTFSAEEAEGWAIHSEHGWMYVSAAAPENFWFWDTRLSWLWAGADNYPYLFSDARGSWVYYYTGTVEPRWFVDSSNLDNPFADDGDVLPPTPPAWFTARVVTQEIVHLDWGAATDNVGVSGYHIYRDGELLLATGNREWSHTETGHDPGSVYEYEVRAIDSAGNLSRRTDPVVVETVPPPMEESWLAAWDASDQEVFDAWYEENTGPGALDVTVNQMWTPTTGVLEISQAWLDIYKDINPHHVFEEDGRWVVYAVRVPAVRFLADNVTLRASLITRTSGVTAWGLSGSGDNAIIEFCEITSDGTDVYGFGLAEMSNYTVRNSEFHGLGRAHLRVMNNATAEYNYIHSGVSGQKHVSISIRGSNTHVRRNNLQTNSGSATLGIYSHDALAPATGLSNVLVEENILNATQGSYAMMAGGEWNSQSQQATNIVVINNAFGSKFYECSGASGANYLWLGRAPAGQYEDDRGNIWGGNRWVTTGNYIRPVTGHGNTCPNNVYDDPYVP